MSDTERAAKFAALFFLTISYIFTGQTSTRMRKVFAFLVICTLMGITSCSKLSEKTPEPEVPQAPQEPQPTSYTINGIHDVSLEKGDTASLDLSVDITYTGSPISLSILGVPQGATASFSILSGSASFSSILTLSNTNALAGVYPCVLKSNFGDSSRHINFTITIPEDPLCDVPGNYTYNITQLCDPTYFGGSLTTSEQVTPAMSPIPNAVNPIRFSNFGGYAGLVVQAKVNCSNGTIEIPIQSVATNMEIGGVGSFTSSGMTISYTIYNNGNQSSCSFTMIKNN